MIQNKKYSKLCNYVILVHKREERFKYIIINHVILDLSIFNLNRDIHD